MSREQFGTTAAVYHKLHYNIRGQLFDVRASAVNDEWGGELGALVNYYSTWWAHGGSGPDNNGNVLMSQTIINSYYMEDRYSYDSLNRLTAVNEWQNGSTHTGSQQYTYDRWGNRTINPASWGTGINTKQFTVDTTTNRLGVPGGQPGAMAYDGAGNLTNDTYTSFGSRTYDANNKMTSAQDSFPGWSYYTYNADGQRTRRKINNQETWQIYGFDGELLAEYAANAAASSTQKEYGYRNGQLLVRAEPGIKWLIPDHLGTPRMIIDQTGTLANIKRHDYLPFGEELFAGVGGRTTGLGYSGGDGVRQQFTSQERDTETGLDYFGARYYSSTQGRFTSPDDFWKDSQIGDPQSWNKYTYVRNNPLMLIDPEGEKATVAITTNEEAKTGTIKITASIAIWNGDSANITADELQAAAGQIQSSINKAWSGQYEQDGIKYTVTTEVTVQAYATEAEAVAAGSQNVIEMINRDVAKNVPAESGRGLFSSYDYGTWNINAVGTRTIAHEFGHLLGAGHGPNEGQNLLTQSSFASIGVATANDYGRALGGAINIHRNHSRKQVFRGRQWETHNATTGPNWGPPRSQWSIQELRPGRFWWN